MVCGTCGCKPVCLAVAAGSEGQSLHSAALHMRGAVRPNAARRVRSGCGSSVSDSADGGSHGRPVEAQVSLLLCGVSLRAGVPAEGSQRACG